MKRAAFALAALLLLTGCWDQLPLRELNLVDIAGLDFDEENGNVEIDFVVTRLKKAGQGEGEPHSDITVLKGASVVEAFGQGEYTHEGPFLAIDTRLFLLSERFAARDPADQLAFLLRAPYTSINTPVVVFEGKLDEYLMEGISSKQPFTDNVNDFVRTMDANGILPHVTMMHFILSREDPLDDLLLPSVKVFDTGLQLSGAQLYRNSRNTGKRLDREQVRMVMLMMGNGKGKQRFAGNIGDVPQGKQTESGRSGGIEYGFSIKKTRSDLLVRTGDGKRTSITVKVEIRINAFDLGKEQSMLQADYVNGMERELARHLERRAKDVIRALQEANCDALGIGKQIKAFHPKLWKAMDWREAYPKLSIEPKFEVKILNAETK